jgi:hypothetical protein
VLLRRIIEHVSSQNWTAVFVDFVIVVVGVFVGLQAQEWNIARQDQERLDRIVASLKADMYDARRVESGFWQEIQTGLAAFEAAHQRGERPAPFVYRIKGSDTAPKLIWGTLQDAGLGALLDPQLLFELSHFYSERDGIGVKITRYMESIEQDVLPYLQGDPSHFYDPTSGEMLPEYRATMDRLREWGEFVTALGPWSQCLENRLENASEPGASCRGDYFTDFGD